MPPPINTIDAIGHVPCIRLQFGVATLTHISSVDLRKQLAGKPTNRGFKGISGQIESPLLHKYPNIVTITLISPISLLI